MQPNVVIVDLRYFKLWIYVRSNILSLKYQRLYLDFECLAKTQFQILQLSFVYNIKAHIILSWQTIVLEALLMYYELFTIFKAISWVSANFYKKNIFIKQSLPNPIVSSFSAWRELLKRLQSLRLLPRLVSFCLM